MPASLDLNFLPLVRQDGQDQPEWPGLYVATPPRGAARGRDADLLAIYLTVTGTAPLPADQFSQLLPRLAQVFYRTPGTATSALKAVVEELNQYLLDRNLRASNTGRQGVGLLTQAVLRGEMLYLAHSGPIQTYVINSEASSLMADEIGSGRGLGISRTASVRYFQTSLQPEDHLLFSHRPAPTWSIETVRRVPGQGIEGLRRALLAQSGTDLNAVLVQVLGGTGKMRLLRLKSPLPSMAHPAAAQPIPEELPAVPTPAASQPQTALAAISVSVAAVTPDVALPAPALDQPEDVDLATGWSTLPADPGVLPVLPVGETPLPASQPAPEVRHKQALPLAEFPSQPASPVAAPVRPAKTQPPAAPKPKPAPRPLLRPLLQGVRAVFQAIGRALGKVFGALGSMLKGLLPDETLLNISPSTMIFLAVLVPVVISILGGMMYLQRGQAMQHESYLQKARIAIERAQASEIPDEQRSNWLLAVNMLDEAEFYQTSTQSRALRQQAQGVLDAMDGVERLAFQPALLTSLGDTVHITRMVAQPTGELYMLDGPSGIVLRAISVGGAYELDRSFLCGPATDPEPIGPLIDLVALPTGNEMDAAVVAMDANGSLMYCIPNDLPEIVQLAPPPMNFSTPKGLALSGSDLYVLDPGNNGVWIYRNMDFVSQPRLFFGDQVPNLQDVVDLVVKDDDLYLLHSDGRQTLCYYSSMLEAPTRCEDPMIYNDGRLGRSGGPIIPDSLFDQILFAPPPDPSLYLLDPANQAVFHFSLRLNFQRQYRSSTELPEDPVSAFTISSNRVLFFAVENQVFFAAIP